MNKQLNITNCRKCFYFSEYRFDDMHIFIIILIFWVI